MLAVSPGVSSPPVPRPSGGLGSARSLSELPIRRLFMDDEDHDDTCDTPSVQELLDEVTRLQVAVKKLPPSSRDDGSPGVDYNGGGGTEGHLDASTRSRVLHNVRTGAASVSSRLELRRRQSSFASFESPNRESSGSAGRLNASFNSELSAPRQRESLQHHSGRPPTKTGTATPRVAALTKENISLLRAPHEYRRGANYAGSACGSQKSRTSARTDGGAVFSRLYQPDFYKNRDDKLRAIRDRQDSMSFSFVPKINQHSSVCSRDSIGSSSVGSMRSAKTDVLNVSSRLYDPDYMRKRSAKLQRMREERELRNCTFTPTINASGSSQQLSAARRTSRTTG